MNFFCLLTSVLSQGIQNVLQYGQGLLQLLLTGEETAAQSDWVTCQRPQNSPGFLDFTV